MNKNKTQNFNGRKNWEPVYFFSALEFLASKLHPWITKKHENSLTSEDGPGPRIQGCGPPISFERYQKTSYLSYSIFFLFSRNNFHQFDSLQLLHLDSRECCTNSRQPSRRNLWLHSSENYSHSQSSPLVP